MNGLLAFGAISLVLLCGALAELGNLLLGSFAQIERAATQQQAAQLYGAFESDLGTLALATRDYAEWDDTVAFVENQNPQFVAKSFGLGTLLNMRVDIVWLIDADGRELYSCMVARDRSAVLAPAPRPLLASLQPYRDVRRLAQLSPAERVVVTPYGLAAIAAMHVTHTDQTRPTAATLLFGRLISAPEIQHIRNTSRLDFQITHLASPQSIAALPAPVRAFAQGDAGRTFAWARDAHAIDADALIRSVDHVPVAMLSTTQRRDTYALGQRMTGYLLGTILVLAIALGTAVTWFLARLQRSYAARHSAEMRYRIIGQALREPVVLIDAETSCVLEANELVLQGLNCTSAQLAECSVTDIFPDVKPAALKQLSERGERAILESRARRPDGSWMQAEIVVTSAEIDARRLLALVARDVSHRKQAEIRERARRRDITRIAQQDALTGLPNRAYLYTRLPRVLQKLAANGRLLALMYLDLDHFKNINDSRGHPQGDQLLRTVAKRLRATVSAEDMVVRMGGDEFVVVAVLRADLEQVDQLAQRLRTAVSAPVLLGEDAISVTATLGIAAFPEDGADADTLLKHADIALYNAKAAGRNCHRFFSSEMTQRVSEHAALEQALRQARGTDQIFLEYQPIVDLRNGRITSLEALMRWRHPEQGLISPARFIPVAEQSGQIVALGEFALRRALLQLREWLDQDVPIVPIAVNVSPLQLERTDFADMVAQLAAEARVELRWLRFEITESAVMKEPERLIEMLARLRQRGSKILVDDFGTGYSSLSYLNQLPVDVLKIDRAFVADLGTNVARLPIINAVIDMARQLKLATVAEGVETAEQAAVLLELGCDLGQGYLYSRPQSAAACRRMLEELKREAPLTQTVLVRALSLSRAS